MISQIKSALRGSLESVKALIRSMINIIKFRGSHISFFSSIDFSSTMGSRNYLARNANLFNCKLGNNISIFDQVNVNSSEIGDFVKIHSNSVIINSKIGRMTYMAGSAFINQASIGSFCSIGPNVKIGSGEHPTDFLSTSPVFYSTGRQLDVMFAKANMFEEVAGIEIGNDVHISANVYIKNGVKIGNGVIIGAGAVVVKNVEDFSIVGGVPAKLIRKRFSEEIINEIKEIEWWNLGLSVLEENAAFFQKSLTLDDIILLKQKLNSNKVASGQSL